MQLGSHGTGGRHTLPHGRHAGYAGIVDLPATLGVPRCGVVDYYKVTRVLEVLYFFIPGAK